VLVALSLLLILRIHAHTVKSDCFKDLLPHDVHVGIVRQLQVKEAGVCLRQQYVLVRVFRLACGLNHEAHVVALEVFVVGRNALLSPAELNELLLLVLSTAGQELPEHLYDGRVLVVEITMLAAESSVPFKQVNVDVVLAANPDLELLAGHYVENAGGDNLADAAFYC